MIELAPEERENAIQAATSFGRLARPIGMYQAPSIL